MKAWLLRWLGAVPVKEVNIIWKEVNIIWTGHEKLAQAFQSHKLEADAAISELIAELNLLRNSIPVAATHTPTLPVRVFRNFREFRTEAERRPGNPIKIERTS